MNETDIETVAEWVARLDGLGGDATIDAVKQIIDAAPAAARTTPDYWFARGHVAAQIEAKLC